MKTAFTLIEILIVIALFSSVVLIGVPLSQSNLNSSEVETATEVSVSSIRIAEAYSRSSTGDSDWGVHFQNNKVIVFKGSDFLARDQEYDIETIFSNKIGFTGLGEIVFSKLRGLPDVSGNIYINTIDRTQTITINDVGGLDY